jgi:hypothetical protein
MMASAVASSRPDLAIAQAAEMLQRSLVEDFPAQQVREYASILRQFAIGTGMEAFDRLVRPFIRQLLAEGRITEAKQAVAITRSLLEIDPASQFELELAALERQVEAQ